MRKLLTVAAATTMLLVSAGQVQATPTQLNLQKCLQLTTATALRSKPILANLGLTPDQVRELRSRLTTYNSVGGFKGLEGVGLTPEQEREIQRRIDVQVAEMNKYPLGWPCKPFKNPALVVTFMKVKLIENGYRPAMSFRKTSPRQFQFRAIQDGVEQLGVVVKSRNRQITVSLQSVSPRWSSRYTFKLGFEA